MAAKQLSYAQLTRDIVQASPEPLPVDEIIKRVNTQLPITSKNPESTIRGAIGDSVMLVNTGDGRYGWKTHVINGSILRYPLRESDLLMKVLQYSDELKDAIRPIYFALEVYRDLKPSKCVFAGMRITAFIGQFVPQHLDDKLAITTLASV